MDHFPDVGAQVFWPAAAVAEGFLERCFDIIAVEVQASVVVFVRWRFRGSDGAKRPCDGLF